MANRILTRNEMDQAYCWAVEDVFPSDEAWEQELESCKELPARLVAYEGKLAESAETLLAYLNDMEDASRRMRRLFLYTSMKSDEDTANPTYQALKGRCFGFLVQLNSATAWEGPALCALEDDVLARFYAEVPALEKFRRYLDKERQGRDHILSPAEEALLASAGEVFNSSARIFNTLNDADMKFPEVLDSAGNSHPLTNGSYLSLISSSDRTLRENAFHSFYKVYRSFENTLAATYNAEVRKNVFLAKARKFDSALQSSLAPNEVPEAVYHNLVSAVRGNLDKLHRYMALRKKIMKLDELHLYDVYANMLPQGGQVIPFEQAKNEVCEAVKVMGEEYAAILESSFAQRWTDVYENVGKRSGAYSTGCYDTHPFMLMSFKDNLKSEFTLAHELGHSMHTWYSCKNQPAIYANYVLFVAEVASTCNEAILMQYLLKQTEDKGKRAVLINHFLEQFRTTLYRQTMFAEFELKAHQMAEAGQTLTAKVLNEMYLQLNKDYFGEGTVADEDIAIEWARIPHFYRHFYVYQYSTGFSAAMALSRRILTEGEPAVQDYLKFLSGGSSTDPISLLKIAGVDMSTPDPVNSALEQFGELISELEALVEG